MSRVITREELNANDGQEGRPAYVAYKGKVYDVSNSRLWRNGVHVRRHHAGNDLTADFSAAPHDESVLERVPVVGVLADHEVERREEAEGWGRLLIPLLDFYFDLHPHPVAVHFPIALGVVSAVFLVLYLLTGVEALEASAYYVLWAALITTPLAMLSGAVSWWFNYGQVMDDRFGIKFTLSIVLLIVEAFALAKRDPVALMNREPLGWVYVMAVLAVVPLVAILGWVGARIAFPPRRRG